MFSSAGLLAQNKKLANAQKLIGNRNRIVQLAELGKKQNPVKCDISMGELNAAKIRVSLESAKIAMSGAMNNIEISDTSFLEKLGTLGQEVFFNIDKALQNNDHLESAINSAKNLLDATIDYKKQVIDNFEVTQKNQRDAYNDIEVLLRDDFSDSIHVRNKVIIAKEKTIAEGQARAAIQLARFCQGIANVVYDILSLSKTEPTIGGRSTRRNRKNNRKTRRN